MILITLNTLNGHQSINTITETETVNWAQDWAHKHHLSLHYNLVEQLLIMWIHSISVQIDTNVFMYITTKYLLVPGSVDGLASQPSNDSSVMGGLKMS